MLIFEGLYYALATSVFSLVLATLFSLIVVKPLTGQLWFLSYDFLIWPLLCLLPVIIILGIVIPAICYAAANKQSVVERLRDSE